MTNANGAATQPAAQSAAPSGGRKTIAVACGGTGGHIYPGLATARELRARGHDVTVWLAGREIEERTLAEWDGAVFRTGARPLRAAGLPALLRSVWRSWRAMGVRRPDALLAMGSYASLPPVLAARSRGVPVVLHEANAIPGKAVARLSRLARVTAISFEECATWLPRARLARTGLPVRLELRNQLPLEGFRQTGGFTVLVTGGSQGAHALNLICRDALAHLARSGAMPSLRIIHQTGAADEPAVRASYADAGADAQVFAFLREMGRAYAAADLAIGRAGAATCAEICLCGVPALLVPLPTAVRDHQRANAMHLVAAQAADMRPQSELTPEWLAGYIVEMQRDRVRRERMRARLLSLAVPDAAARLADAVLAASAGVRQSQS
ncbi:MAG: UDP-N-acetylglucosamine--N-acetylmuramyl-(pentapeptide) pyrophosphoryl-undecaprenol N-acetylglucosamine transferase [Kiritimatiellae bacterium]|nr:UDP-N-acetylglucosamine--N-acetylmuramyl-(pentapeptide) pyrophosphoryl-undecaprenol N-acetylglucosamine transferase [Kiritimatiellia bacterium]